jgi:CubicO group peptidase (beta-lactamase class C family)
MIKGMITTLTWMFFAQGHGQHISKIDSLLQFYEQTQNLNGVILIAQKGKMIYHKSFGYANMEWKVKNTTETKFKVASISKLFTVVLCFQLFEKNQLSPDQTISKYLPDYPNGDEITIHQLLTHTSGIIDHRDVSIYDRKYGMMKATRQEWVDVFKDSALKFPPGKGWYYSNFGYNLLAMIIEKITGKSLEENLSENIFKPAGMQQSVTMEHNRVIDKLAFGYERVYNEVIPARYYDGAGMAGAGSVITTASDLKAFMTSLKNGKLIKKENVAAIYSKLYKDEYGDYTAYNGRYFSQHLPKNDSTEIAYFTGNHSGTHTLLYDETNGDRQLILLLNIKTPKLFEIADNTLNIIFGVPFDWPRDSYVRLFARDIAIKGVLSAVEQFKRNKNTFGAKLLHAPRDLNKLGYYYLQQGNAFTAMQIFKLNLEYFKEADFYDSLGEAYLQLGEKEKAIENLRKAIELDPSNTHAKELLDQLQQ